MGVQYQYLRCNHALAQNEAESEFVDLHLLGSALKFLIASVKASSFRALTDQCTST